MKLLIRQIYFGFIAVLTLSELIASKLQALFINIERPAELMAISIEVARTHMSIMAALDLISGIGALLVLWAGRRMGSNRLGRIGVIATALGIFAAGCYQFWFAIYELGAIQGIIKVVGVTYIVLGIIASFIGRDFMQDSASTEQPVSES